MANQTLIATIVVGLGLAFVFGALAHRLRIPLLIGYLIAGVIIGPFTPGYVADQALALQLAEVGVILLMFGVGLHFSLHDLLSVRAVAIPGAIGQMAIVSALGFGLAHAMGWPAGAGVVFGLALSVASTVVVLRALQERRLIDTDRGRIVVGWLIVEDLAMILVLVLLPALAPLLGGQAPPEVEVGWFGGFLDPHSIWSALGLTLAKLAAYFSADVGRRAAAYSFHPALRGALGFARIVPPRGTCVGSQRGVRLGPAVRRVICARRFLRRHGAGGVDAQPAGRSGNVATERRFCGPVLRFQSACSSTPISSCASPVPSLQPS